eukprot:TRINITY_DN62742_c0_g1_i1.p1 TRINITY_DN62742_c0_g1~~TRINITY_DN62742_c0_g1_i1.p1  ORF type:complete len:1044 (-),score=241.20 TRINITY_DN62742_c0_g1_i1:37-3168(-)
MSCGLPHISDDPEVALHQYKQLRTYARETFNSFLRNLNSRSLRSIEHTFDENDGEMEIAGFMEMCMSVFPKVFNEDIPHIEEQQFIMKLAGKMLFEDVDVDRSGGADWMEFVNFVCAIAETLRVQAEHSTAAEFEFHESVGLQVVKNLRPSITKCLFNKVYYWPQHPSENVVVFEEGQSAFHLHKVKTMQRRKRCEGHRSDLLSATFMSAPYDWVVTSGNDKLVCFWDSGFNLIKKWKMDHVVGALCWCPEINALYFSEQFAERVSRHKEKAREPPPPVMIQAWRITDPLTVRASDKPAKVDKTLTFITGHTQTIQLIIWLKELQCIVTASLDTTVRMFDLVSMEPRHVFTAATGGHTKGVICLDYCPKLQLLISAGFNNYISLWDPEAGVRFHTLMGHDCSIAALSMVPGTDNELLSCDMHGVVKLWDLRKLTCVQSFYVTEVQAEKAGEIECLEPRTMCLLNRDRFVVSGRRMVAFERDCSQPQLTSDTPIMAMAFNPRKFEIATSVQNNVRIWCALTGKVVAVHNAVVEGNITCISLGLGMRRCFIGSDKGELAAINFSCGAPLKDLTPHVYEVSQILCGPTELITLSTAEKLVRVHDDTNPEKALVLKEIFLTHLEPVLRIAYDGERIMSATTEDGTVNWFAIDHAKQVAQVPSNTHKVGDTLVHDGAISCCQYLQTAPLMVTADSDSNVFFWSFAPLRPYEFFCKLKLSFNTPSGAEAGASSAATAGSCGITCICFSWPDEERMIVGTETGTLACVSIREFLNRAKSQRDEILYRKENGESAFIISGKIFESMPKPCDSEEYVISMSNEWMVKAAHRGGVDQVIYCQLEKAAVITLGFDMRVCAWDPSTGAPLGTLEQGLPEGLSYKPVSQWHFPIDPHEQIRLDLEGIVEAETVEASQESEHEDVGKVSDAGRASVASARSANEATGKQHSKQSVARSSLTPARSQPTLRPYTGKEELPDYSHVKSRLLRLPDHRKRYSGDDWFAGPYAPANAGMLPKLSSGKLRPLAKESNDLVNAARRLSSALGGVKSSHDMSLR